MAGFRIGDRVEIVGDASSRFQSRVGVITGVPSILYGGNFIVQLADGAEHSFLESELNVPPVILADMIFDTVISPLPSGLRGVGAAGRYMRFIAREFDISLELTKSHGKNDILGQLASNDASAETSLVTLLFDGKPYARTAMGSDGEFELRDVRAGPAALEILGPGRRILATFDNSPA